MSEDILRELRELRTLVIALTERLQRLEQRVGVQREAPTTPVRPVTTVTAQTTPKSTAPRIAKPREGLETTIGRYWLQRLGIISLVLGIAFFILYSFQYLGPAAKIGIGFAVGALLVGGGAWLERVSVLRWYGRGLMGGGWAVIYFTTYAMHHIPAVRLLDSALLDLVLLLGVTIGAVGHSLRYRSQSITAFAFALGFITTAISHVTYFTLASSILLALGLSWVVVRMRWHALALYGAVGTYAAHRFWIAQQIAWSPVIAVHTATVQESRFWLTVAFLGTYWVIYHVLTLVLDERDAKPRHALLTTTLVNALCFVPPLLAAMQPLYAEFRYLALLAVGGVYVLSSLVAQPRRPALSTTQLLLGLTFLTLAVPLKLSHRWTSFLWLTEVASLAWLGLRYDRRAYRLFAAGLTLVMLGWLLSVDFSDISIVKLGVWRLHWRLLVGIYATLALAATATCYRAPRWRAVHHPWERQAFHGYLIVAAILALIVVELEGHRHRIPLLLAALASGFHVAGFRLQDRVARLIGAVGFGVTVLQLMVQLFDGGTTWTRSTALGCTALLYGMGLQYRALPAGLTFVVERWSSAFCTALATLVLTLYLYLDITSQWLSLTWALEGLLLVGAGFALRHRPSRIAGLSVFGVLVLKILFVDLAGAETIYRIISFIVAGVMLLLASLAYARFTAQRPKPNEEPQGLR